MAYLTVRGSVDRGASCSESLKRPQRGFVGKIEMQSQSFVSLMK